MEESMEQEMDPGLGPKLLAKNEKTNEIHMETGVMGFYRICDNSPLSIYDLPIFSRLWGVPQG